MIRIDLDAPIQETMADLFASVPAGSGGTRMRKGLITANIRTLRDLLAKTPAELLRGPVHDGQRYAPPAGAKSLRRIEDWLAVDGLRLGAFDPDRAPGTTLEGRVGILEQRVAELERRIAPGYKLNAGTHESDRSSPGRPAT